MANFQNFLMFLLLILTFIVCLQNQPTEGRQLKAMKEQLMVTSTKMEIGLQIHARKAVQKPGIAHQENFQGQKQVSAPTQSHEEFSSSDVLYATGSESTTPGNSPGIGHSLVVQNKQDLSSVSDQKDDFKGPGHSPGVGHSFGPKP